MEPESCLAVVDAVAVVAVVAAAAVIADGRKEEERLREQSQRYHWGNQGTTGQYTPHHPHPTTTDNHHPPTPHQPHTKQGECLAIALAVPLAVALAVAVLNLC